MKLWKFRDENNDEMEVDFNFNLKIGERRVVLSSEISSGLDLRILFSVLAVLKDMESKRELDIEELHEFEIENGIMKYSHSEEAINLPCRIEPVIINTLIEKKDGEEFWRVIYKNEYEELKKWNISA